MQVQLIILISLWNQIKSNTQIVVENSIQPQKVTIGEQRKINLENYFNGFNLYFELADKWQNSKLVDYSNKVLLNQYQDNQYLDVEKCMAKAFQKSIDGEWGEWAAVLLQNNIIQLYKIKYKDEESLTFNSSIQLPYTDSHECIDIEWLNTNQGQLIIDCLSKQRMANLMIVYNVPNQSIDYTKTFSQYIENTNNRSFLNVIQHISHQDTFIIRGTQDVLGTRKNSYIEVYRYDQQNQEKITLLNIIDRSSLEAKQFDLQDMKIIEDNLYILDQAGVVYRINNLHSNLKFKSKNIKTEQYLKMDIYINRSKNDKQVLIVLAGLSSIQELDWSDINQPRKLKLYSFNDQVKNIEYFFINYKFYIYQFIDPNDNRIIYIFKQNQNLFKNIFRAVNCGNILDSDNTKQRLVFNKLQNKLLVINKYKILLYGLQSPILSILPNNDEQIGNSYTITFNVKSQDYKDKNNVVQIQQSVNLTVLNQNNIDVQIFNKQKMIQNKENINYPGATNIPFTGILTGPALNYTVSYFNDSELKYPIEYESYQFHRINRVNNAYSEFLDIQELKQMRLSQMKTFDNDIYWIYQLESHTLQIVYCQIEQFRYDKKQKPYCSKNQTLELENDIKHVYLTRFKKLDQTSFYLGIQFVNDLKTVWIYELGKQEFFRKIEYKNDIDDFKVSEDKLFIVQSKLKTITIKDYISDSFEHEVNRMQMEKVGILEFNPIDIYLSDYFKNLMFIKDQQGIHIVNIGYLNEGYFQKINSIISDSFTKSDQYQMIINENCLVVFNQKPQAVIEEYSLTNINNIYRRKTYPLYGFQIEVREKSYDWFVTDTIIMYRATRNGKNYLLLYKSNTDANNVLYQIQEVEQNTKFIHLAGSDQKFMTIVGESDVDVYRVYGISELYIQSRLDHINSANLVPYHIENKIYMKISASSQLVNYMNLVRPDYNETFMVYEFQIRNSITGIKIIKDHSSINFRKNQTDIILDFIEYVQGNLIQTRLDCDQCHNINNLKNKEQNISKSQRILFNDGLNELDRIDMNQTNQILNGFRKTYILQDQYLIVVQNMKVLKRKKLVDSDDVYCKKMGLGKFNDQEMEENYLLVGCINNQTHKYMILCVSFMSSDPFVIFHQQLDIEYANTIKIVDDFVFILNSDEDPLIRSQEILIYRLNFTQFEGQVLEQINSITGTTIQNINNQFTSFDCIRINMFMIRIFITNYNEGLFMIDIDNSGKQRDSGNNLSPYFQSTISNDAQDPQQTYLQLKYVQVKVLDNKKSECTSVTKLILVLNNFNSYIIQVSLQDTIIDLKVLKALVKHGFYQVNSQNIGYSYFNQSVYFAIHYDNIKNPINYNNQSIYPQIIALYQFREDDTEYYTRFTNAVPINTSTQSNRINIYHNILNYYNQSSQQMVFTQIDKKRLVFQDFDNTLNTNLIFRIQNGYYTKTLTILTDIQNEINKKNNDSNHRKPYILIILTSCSAIVVLLIIAFIFYRRRQQILKKQQKNQMLLEQNDDFDIGFDLLKKRIRIQQQMNY